MTDWPQALSEMEAERCGEWDLLRLSQTAHEIEQCVYRASNLLCDAFEAEGDRTVPGMTKEARFLLASAKEGIASLMEQMDAYEAQRRG